jgi:hypothetical protein
MKHKYEKYDVTNTWMTREHWDMAQASMPETLARWAKEQGVKKVLTDDEAKAEPIESECLDCNNSVFEFIECPICKVKVRKDRINKHTKKVHGKPQKSQNSTSEYEGININLALRRNEKWYVQDLSKIINCEECRKPLVLLQTDANRFKKFDCLRTTGLITDTHECQAPEKSTSVYAYSGGIVDSNRRKH